MNDYTFKLTFKGGGTLTTTVSAPTRFTAETILREMYPEARWCDFIPTR